MRHPIGSGLCNSVVATALPVHYLGIIEELSVNMATQEILQSADASPSPTEQAAQHPDSDPFAPLFSLEDEFYAEGLQLGITDGTRAGKIEGRTFGLEKGFEKFAEMGHMNGRSAVWAARLDYSGESKGVRLKGSERLQRNVSKLSELTSAETLSTVNDEDDVNEFDDRLRDAKAKAVLVARMVGEKDSDLTASEASRADGSALRVKPATNSSPGGAGREMEDFTGLPMLKK